MEEKKLEEEVRYIPFSNDSQAFKVVRNDLYYRSGEMEKYRLLEKDFDKPNNPEER